MKKRNLLCFFLLITILATIAVLTSCKKNDINNFIKENYHGKSIKISYITNGGNSLQDDVLKYGDKYNQPTTIKPNHTFKGWYLDKELNNLFDMMICQIKCNMKNKD